MSVRKDLGMVTAYAYAVSKGYTGTEEQFATLMASYADVGQTAVDAALAAKASEDAAKASETASAASQTAAATSAGTAQTAAQAATGAATTATTAATEAAQSATSAAGSATTAGASATAAQAAQTAAEAAQTAAETAQAAAEAAAQTLVIDPTLTQPNQAAEAKATGDAISLLKSHLNAIDIVDTASGAIASFADGSDGVPVKSLMVTMNPIQDLHGQDAPYPAGGGKNKYSDIYAEYSKPYDYYIHKLSLTEGNWKLSAGLVGTAVTGCVVGIVKSGERYSEFPEILQVITTTGVAGSATLSVDSSWTDPALVVYCTGETQFNQIFSAYHVQLESGTAATTYAPYSNICPISGRQSVTVWRSGVNVFDGVWESGSIEHRTGEEKVDPGTIRTGFVPVKGGRNYILSWDSSQSLYIMLMAYKADKTYLQYIGARTITPTLITLDADTAFLRWITYVNTVEPTNMQLELGSTATAYEAPQIQTVTIPLGQTVYGGTVDVVSGEMVVDRYWFKGGWTQYASGNGYKAYRSAEVPRGLGINDIDSKPMSNMISTFSSFSSSNMNKNIIQPPRDNTGISFMALQEDLNPEDVELSYIMLNPITIILTPEQLTTVLGINNVWSDADSVSVDYVADTKLYIAQLTEPDADMVADANITSGQYFMVGNSLFLATANIASGAAIAPGVNCTKTSLAAALNAINS